MNTQNRLSKIVTILFVLVCFGMISYAQKPAANKTKAEKLLPFTDFKNTDIGPVAIAGSATVNKDEIEIVAGGADIWGTKDQFHFCFKQIKGDFDIRTQVLSLTAANLYTKAGFMARVDLDDNSRHIFYQVFPTTAARNNNNGGCEFQYRVEKAGQMKAIYPDKATAGNKFDVAFPNTWIRLKRTGDVFEGYMSSDNKEWTLYATYTLKLPEELFVGLAVTAHSKTATTTAKFASVRLKK